ncbi:hypothetical protein IW140_000648 [Coemansia sp. RSA 1813]|nr:hypothetical protein EV178_003352 [Coemansia sp. RSA 1646]KAJ1774116.1 hypothetical protein LPJ74_000215 [Coemansia sp. RSA 1843]KAJ2085475.1 hypothetical protein IW138_006310 [Coemansia sp. RSA 986]KAJ2216813.1 hypothetical protein EV179_001103 [Coemansia sp. RSA 487]KAJ2572885.1 hypothetical protein IW140_000648 [Coemansia sp. RSA 1813]
MHATPRFFDSTPVGRIVSRFSGDMDSIDQGLISMLIGWLSSFVSLAMTVVIIMSVVPIARALVRRFKLIVMDEATAAVGFDTDKRLQRTIRGYEFVSSTLFCIAHRLRTIIDYDQVLVLDKGKVVEFDTPNNLLQKNGGVFRSMCEKIGEYEYLASTANR